MSNKRNRFLLVGAALAALTAVTFIIFCLRTPYLVLQNADNGRVRFAHPAPDGETFSIVYIHSVNQSPVAEIYEIRDSRIVLVAFEFEAFGAGVPTELEPGQTLIHLPEGGMRIEGLDRVIDNLHYLIAHATDLTLHIGGSEVPLLSLDEAGQSLRFSVQELNLWQRQRTT
ncbi:MAG: DUF1850 domain-containing protein [Oscillospiraceae bacterium]|nr:DUF1850 domain-containing protein [Oscillospiraceae bacterium]